MVTKDTLSSCSDLEEQQMQQIQEKAKKSCMVSFRQLHSHLDLNSLRGNSVTNSRVLIGNLNKNLVTCIIFKRTFSQDLDLLEHHLTKEIISQSDCKTTLTKLRNKFKNAFSSEIKRRMQNLYIDMMLNSFYDASVIYMDSLGKYMLHVNSSINKRTLQLLKQKKLMQTQEDHSNIILALNVDSLKVDLVAIQNTCSEKEDSNSETASSKLVKECSLKFSNTKDVHFLSTGDLKGNSALNHGFKMGIHVTLWSMILLLSQENAPKRRQLKSNLTKTIFMKMDSMAASLGGQQHSEQLEIIVKGRVDQYPETCHVKSHVLDSSPDNQTTEYSKQSLVFEMQHGQILNETSNKAKIEKEIDVLETVNIELEHSVAKLQRDRNSTTSVTTSARFQSTADGSKPKPRSNNQTSRSLPVSKSTRVTITAVPKADT
ncbi:hypothetical protein Tco_0078413 [Tanacetum coccineum]